MLSFDYKTSREHLRVEETIVHEDVVVKKEVRVGIHGYGDNFEEEVETVDQHVGNVPVEYLATVYYDGEPILRYRKHVGYDYLRECFEDGPWSWCSDDLDINDEDFAEWLYNQRNDCIFLDYVLECDETSYFDEVDHTCTIEDIIRNDSEWMEVQECR